MNRLTADVIFYGGPVLTVDKDDRVCEAAAVKGNRIIAVGSREDVWEFSGDETEKIDLKGKSLIPGIIDSHLHTAVFGMNTMGIDCRPSKVQSIDDMKKLISEAAAETPKGQWIRGWGYDHSKLKEGRHPNRWDLDEAAPDHPVIVTRTCAHISVHNSMSLKIAGIEESTPSPEGGEIQRIDGRVSGVMFENAHMDMMKVSQPSKEELIGGIKAAGDLLVKQGITTVHDSGGYGARQMAAFQESVGTGQVKLRINGMIFSFVNNVSFVKDYLKAGISTTFGDDHFQLGPAKLMIDGSSSGPTAATLEPYTSNPGSCGIMSMEQNEIDEIVLSAHKMGWQMTCHAVGDKAVTAIVDAIEKALKMYPKKDHRHRIEHCAMMNDKLMERIRKLEIIPIPQPIFLYEFGDGYMVNYGKERACRMFPCKSFIDNGVLAAGSSDCPITYSDPFLNMYMAVNRKTQTGQVINEAECVTVKEALRMFTYNGAFASFEEDKKGSIEPGKLADLVVLSHDLYQVPKEDLKDVKSVLTMIDGEIVFREI